MAVQLKPINGGFAGLAKRVPNATVAALNRVAASTRASAAKGIGADLGAKQAAVRTAVAVRKAGSNTMEAQVVATGKRIPLIAFAKNVAGQYMAQLIAAQARGARGIGAKGGRGGGVSYSLGGKQNRIAGTFIARMPTGHVGIFKRAGRARLKIHELFGPSIPLVFAKDKVQTAVRAVIKARMPIEMAAAAKFFGGKG